MSTAFEVDAERMEAYRRTARNRRRQEQLELELREQRAWSLARLAADLLREHFAAGRVVVFGSLAHPGLFTPWSDVDIAAWGIDPSQTFRAIGAVMDLDDQIEVNLVDVGACRPSVLESILQECIDL